MIAAGAAGQTVFARRMEARQGRDAQRLDAKHDSLAPRSGDAPCGQRNGDDTITTRSITACAPSTTPSPPRPTVPVLRRRATGHRTPTGDVVPAVNCPLHRPCPGPALAIVLGRYGYDRATTPSDACSTGRRRRGATSAARTFRSVQATALSAGRREMRTVTTDPLRPNGNARHERLQRRQCGGQRTLSLHQARTGSGHNQSVEHGSA